MNITLHFLHSQKVGIVWGLSARLNGLRVHDVVHLYEAFSIAHIDWRGAGDWP